MSITAAPVPQAVDTPTVTGPKLRNRRFSKRERVFAIVMTVILAPIAIAWIYPFLWTLSGSFKNNAEIFGSLNPFTKVLRIHNWSDAWVGAQLGRYFFNSVFVTVFSVLISVSSAALMGYALGRYRFVGKKIVIAAFALVIFLPEGYTIIPVYDIVSKLHLANSLWGVTLAESGGAHIVVVLLFAGYFSQLPKELEESARMDGAGFFLIFARVYLPLAKPVTATAVILQFMNSWNSFLLPLVLTLSRPELRTTAVGVYVLQNSYFGKGNWGLIAASSVIAMLPIVIVFLCLQRYFVESIAGAVKG